MASTFLLLINFSWCLLIRNSSRSLRVGEGLVWTFLTNDIDDVLSIFVNYFFVITPFLLDEDIKGITGYKRYSIYVTINSTHFLKS